MKYWWAAFNARPPGMFVPPNWVFVAAMGLLGATINPGFLALGAGLEAAYLWWLGGRIRAKLELQAAASPSSESRRLVVLDALDAEARESQHVLEARCAELLGRLSGETATATAETLNHLCWIHARMLLGRAGVAQVVGAADRESRDLARRAKDLEKRLAEASDPELRTSLESQAATLKARLEGHAQARARLALIDAEIERIRQQVELAREQALLALDPAQMGRTVDTLSDVLQQSTSWAREQQQVLGSVDELLHPPPDMLTRATETTT